MQKYATLQMESMAYISYDSVINGDRYEHYSDLALVYKHPLWNRVRDTRFNKPVIPRNSTTLSDFEIGKILREYSARNGKLAFTNAHLIFRQA
jgi:hypothetical protein